MSIKKVYAFDLDGTLCETPGGNDYENSIPLRSRIIKVNQLYAAGNKIIIYTARGCNSGLTPKLKALTSKQLVDWKVCHHELIMGQKIFYDVLVDDKAISDIQWEKEQEVGDVGIIAGSFDILHPGYISMFEESKKVCSRILVALQEHGKRKPVMTLAERTQMLLSLKCVDKVIPYKTEKDLHSLLKSNCPHVRILGSDYSNKDFTGQDLFQSIYYIDRSHGWSTTKLLQKLQGNKNNEKSNCHGRSGVHRKPRR